MEQANLHQTNQLAPKTGFNWNDFLSFKTMITLKIIQIVYTVVALIITIGSIFLIFKSDDRRGYYDSGPSPVVIGLSLLIFGNIVWRIWCELMIVIFRINKSLESINENTKTK
jgi:hypothetical protein